MRRAARARRKEEPTMLLALCASLGLSAVTVTPAEIGDVRGVSNYLYGDDASDLDAWRADLVAMRKAGYNTVWLVNVWAQFQPSVLSPHYDGESIRTLRGICAEARKLAMNVLVVVAYVGEGWGPKGLDVPVWPLVESHRREHLRFLARMARETREFGNAFYLLCSEEILPATVLYSPADREECVAAFRKWALADHPDVAYWNERWSTDFTEATLRPLNTGERHTWQAWADHNRWFASLLHELVPPMADAIRREKPGALIGFHDFLLDPALPPERADAGMPPGDSIDFASLGYYVDKGVGLDDNLAKLKGRLDLCRRLYPTMPLFVGEIGYAIDITSEGARRADEARSTEWFARSLRLLHDEGVGYSAWCWRTVVPGAKESFSLIREDGTHTPMFDTIKAANRFGAAL
jgi:hypothetical protein